LPRVRQMAEASYKNAQGGIVELLDTLDAISEAKLHDIELSKPCSGPSSMFASRRSAGSKIE
jgi:hypothetical protein